MYTLAIEKISGLRVVSAMSWLLSFIVLTNGAECPESINDIIVIQAEATDSTREEIHQSTEERTPEHIGSNIVKNITVVVPTSTSPVIAVSLLEPVTTSPDLSIGKVYSNIVYDSIAVGLPTTTAAATAELTGNLLEPLTRSLDHSIGKVSPNKVHDSIAAGPSTTTPSTQLTGNLLETVTTFNSLHDSQYFENTRGINPTQSTHSGIDSLSVDISDDMYSLSLVDNKMAAGTFKLLESLSSSTIDPLLSIDSANFIPSSSSYQNVSEIETFSQNNLINSYTPFVNYHEDFENGLCLTSTINQSQSMESAIFMPSIPSTQNISKSQTFTPINYPTSFSPDINRQEDTEYELHLPLATYPIQATGSENSIPITLATQNITEIEPPLPIQFKSYSPNINSQEDIDDELVLPLGYQYMFDKRTSPWEMKDWDQDDLNSFTIQPEKIDRLYHIGANEEDPNFRTWELCCRIDYNGQKYFAEMYANCDYTGFDCQGGGHICITKLPDFFLNNMVTNDQNPDQIYRALLEDGYDVQEPDPLHKMHPRFWNNTPMLKYLCHNAIFENKEALPHFKDHLPPLLANSVDDFIKVKEWENE